MQNNDISIYVPVYNGEKTIEKCIYSILNQSLKPNNILVVNDCSNDNTLQILKKFDKNIQILNISKDTIHKNNKTSEEIYILLGSFYSIDTANFLKQRINKDVPEFNINKLKIKKNNIKENLVISGPYNSINSVKNDYILLKTFGFEELDIFFNE